MSYKQRQKKRNITRSFASKSLLYDKSYILEKLNFVTWGTLHFFCFPLLTVYLYVCIVALQP